jgi:hypothetical protein
VADLKMDLEAADAYNGPQTPAGSRSSKLPITLAAVSLFAAMAMAVVLVFNYRGPRESQTVRFLISPPDKTAFDSYTGAGALPSQSAGSVSPDGRKIAFTARDEAGKIMLWVRPLATIAGTCVSGDGGRRQAVLVAGQQMDCVLQRGQAEEDRCRRRPAVARL